MHFNQISLLSLIPAVEYISLAEDQMIQTYHERHHDIKTASLE